MNLVKKIILIFLILIAHLSFSYYMFNDWWYSSLGTALIIFLAYLAWPKKFQEILGIMVTRNKMMVGIVLAVGTAIGAYYLMDAIARPAGIQIILGNILNLYHTMFYTLNEELIVGAMLIYGLRSAFKKMPPIYIAVMLAIIFSAFHYLAYAYIFPDTNRGYLSLVTLISVFNVGVIRNNLIITSRHVGYSWAIHFGWMVIMFGSVHQRSESGQLLVESECFNMYLGSFDMCIISSVLMVLSFLLYKRKRDF